MYHPRQLCIGTFGSDGPRLGNTAPQTRVTSTLHVLDVYLASADVSDARVPTMQIVPCARRATRQDQVAAAISAPERTWK